MKHITYTGLVAAAMMRCTIWSSSARTTTVQYTEPTRPLTGKMRVSCFPGIGNPCRSPATHSRRNEVCKNAEAQPHAEGPITTHNSHTSDDAACPLHRPDSCLPFPPLPTAADVRFARLFPAGIAAIMPEPHAPGSEDSENRHFCQTDFG